VAIEALRRALADSAERKDRRSGHEGQDGEGMNRGTGHGRNHTHLSIHSSGRWRVEANLLGKEIADTETGTGKYHGQTAGLDKRNEMTNLFLSTPARVTGRLQIEAGTGV